MSGAVAAHAAYNGAGTQGLAVTNKINDTGDVTSVFWTKNDTTRQLLHGSSLVEVVSSGTSGQVNTFGSSKIFTINNDVDVLGDLYLDLGLRVTPTFSVNASGKLRTLQDFDFHPNFQFKLIDRVEFMVGTQIWHTLTGDDIKVLTKTLKSEGSSAALSPLITCERFRQGYGDTTGDSLTNGVFEADVSSCDLGISSGGNETVRVVLWIPALSADSSAPLRKFYNITENGYIMAAAPQQSVKIKVTFKNNTDTAKITGRFTESFDASAAVVANSYTSTIDGKLKGTGSYITSSADTAYPFSRIVTGFTGAVSGNTAAGDASNVDISVSISSVRMFAKQIMLCSEERAQIRSVPNGLPFRVKMTQSIRTDITTTEKTIDLDSFSLYASHIIITGDITGSFITEAELKLNSSSFSGSLPSILLKNNMAESLKIFTGKTLNSYAIGATDAGVRYTDHPKEQPILVFPLASTAFSGSGVPLNRFDSIRLTLKFGTTAPVGSAFRLASPGINVTCVGETTVLYKGGAATLAMY
jgi:hypothetical protein